MRGGTHGRTRGVLAVRSSAAEGAPSRWALLIAREGGEARRERVANVLLLGQADALAPHDLGGSALDEVRAAQLAFDERDLLVRPLDLLREAAALGREIDHALEVHEHLGVAGHRMRRLWPGRSAAGSTAITERASAPMSGAASARSSAPDAPGLTVTRSSAAGAMRLSLRIVRMALTMSITGCIFRSASAFAPCVTRLAGMGPP